jgi:hypothetical protein
MTNQETEGIERKNCRYDNTKQTVIPITGGDKRHYK